MFPTERRWRLVRHRRRNGRKIVLDVSYPAAVLAGLLSFISPCVLPIVPPYLAWMAGVSFSDMRSDTLDSAKTKSIAFSSVAFVLGFTTVFVALGASASLLGRTLVQYFDIFSIVAGVLITIMGLHFLGVFRIGFLYREARIDVRSKPAGLIGAYVMGLAFAFGWTPCVGPVLASILMVAGAEGSAARGAGLLAAYSLGIGIPFILAGIFVARFIEVSSRLKKHMRTVEIAVGVLLIVTGILFMTGSMSAIAQWMLDVAPGFFMSIG